jgi:hypothetical protein
LCQTLEAQAPSGAWANAPAAARVALPSSNARGLLLPWLVAGGTPAQQRPKQVSWSDVILNKAQNIKNLHTKQA